MKIKYLLTLSVMLGASATQATAQQQALNNLQTYSGVTPIQTSCSTCHSTIPSLNAFGASFRSLGGTKTAYVLNASAQSSLFVGDADGDGTNNLAELQAGTNPAGGGGATTSSQKASVTGCVSNNIQTPIYLFLGLLVSVLLLRRKEG